MTKLIPLTQGKFAIVDMDKFDWLNQWKWHAVKNRDTWYAARNEANPSGGRRITVKMHREVLGLPRSGKEILGEHRDGNGLNNTVSNLRKATHPQNLRNRPAQKNNKTGMKGVCRVARSSTFRAQINDNGKVIHLGCFREYALRK
jgi:hypothetical protein